MKCPYCNQDMQKGYITSDARFLAWREEKHESANVKKGDGIQLAKKVFGGSATVSDAYCFKACRNIVIDYVYIYNYAV